MDKKITMLFMCLFLMFFICTGSKNSLQTDLSSLPQNTAKQVKVISVSKKDKDCQSELSFYYKLGWRVVTMDSYNDYNYTFILEK